MSIDPATSFREECKDNIEQMGQDEALKALSLNWNIKSAAYKYTYNFTAFGRPIIQFPQDMVAMQELVGAIQPDLIIETGIAHGGSLILYAGILALLDYCDSVASGELLDPRTPKRRVLGIDIDIRAHNRTAIEQHPLAHRIDMIQGSSIAEDVIQAVHEYAKKFKKIMVVLDSNHTHDHVLAELEAYAPLTSQDSYCIVFDTVVEDLPKSMFMDRPWGPSDNPKTAVWEYLQRLKAEGRTAEDGNALNLEIDKTIENKLQITVAPDGYLKRI